MKRLIIIGCLLLGMVMVGPLVAAQETMDVTLQWDANTETDLAGYGVYWDSDQAGPPYANSTDMTLAQDENPDPNIVEKTIMGLPYGVRHWFVVDAFDNEDPVLRSGFSNEVTTDGIDGMSPSDPTGLGVIRITIHRIDGTTVIVDVP